MKYYLIFLTLYIPLLVFAGDQNIKYNNYSASISEILISHDFDELIKIAEKLRRDKIRFTDGRWKLTAFYKGMNPISNNPSDWNQYEDILLAFMKQFGDKSPTPHVALASFYQRKAWSLRGPGYSNTVSQKGWDGWYNNLDLAKKILNNDI